MVGLLFHGYAQGLERLWHETVMAWSFYGMKMREMTR